MLSLQRWWLVTAPTDLRCGIDRLLLAAWIHALRPYQAAEIPLYP
ncbi:hypothetical protein [Xanthomonas oryzae]|uniref:Uncharacterized protein n=1 Tax=Xanthomonas oryzae pv. leersiae TaxID=3112258 RepID=A0AAJ6H2A1_9XANT|nr:hypothetical protein [Xanthomonas oryzae]WIX08406.1 hypothetical protein QN060_10945 [Xanthomonas oryzae pv. oryzae]